MIQGAKVYACGVHHGFSAVLASWGPQGVMQTFVYTVRFEPALKVTLHTRLWALIACFRVPRCSRV